MHGLQYIALFLGTVAAIPQYRGTVATRVNGTRLSHATLDQCDAAFNCETYDTEKGALIRFRPGMEPDSLDYHTRVRIPNMRREQSLAAYDAGNQRRQATPTTTAGSAPTATPTTNVTLGDTNFNWGTIDPTTALGYVSQICPSSGSCINADTAQAPTTIALDCNDISDTNLNLQATGQYDGTSGQQLYLAGLVAAVSKGTNWTTVDTGQASTPDFTYCTPSDTIQQAQQTDFVAVNTFTPTGELQGYITVTITGPPTQGGWCAFIDGLLGAIATLVGAAAPEVGAAGAAVFGAVSASCSFAGNP